jgi:hypothetical protein
MIRLGVEMDSAQMNSIFHLADRKMKGSPQSRNISQEKAP